MGGRWGWRPLLFGGRSADFGGWNVAVFAQGNAFAGQKKRVLGSVSESMCVGQKLREWSYDERQEAGEY